MKYLILILLLPILAGTALAADPQGTISLQYTDADVLEVLASLSQQAAVMIVADSTVKGKVSCGISGMTVAEALDIICKPNKLEWYKAYAGVGDEKPSAGKLFKLLDALKELGGSTFICEDPRSKAQTIFVPSAGVESVNNSAIASQLKLKEMYLIRAEPDPAAIQAEKDKAKANQPANPLSYVPPSDSKAAAQQVWGYFNQMPAEQAFQTMHELSHLIRDNLTPQQRDQLGRYWDRGRDGPPRQ